MHGKCIIPMEYLQRDWCPLSCTYMYLLIAHLSYYFSILETAFINIGLTIIFFYDKGKKIKKKIDVQRANHNSPLKRQSRLHQMTNCATFFLIFEKNKV